MEENNIITKKKGKTGLIIGIIAAVIAIIGIGVFLFIFATGSDTRKVNKQIELGEKYLTELDYENAILCYKEAVKIDPKNEKAYLGLAEAYRIAINHFEEEKDYEKALEYVDDAIDDMKAGAINTNSDEIRDALDEFKEKKEELTEKKDGKDQEDVEEEEKEKEEKEQSSDEGSEIPDDSEVVEVPIPDVEIPFADWGTHDNPVLNQYLESLGYIWVTKDTVSPDSILWVDDNCEGIWTMSRDYGVLYSIYFGQTGLMEHNTTPICFYVGFSETQEYYYWEEIAYDSEILLKVAQKHAQMFPEFSKYLDERGCAYDSDSDVFYIEEEYYDLRDEFYNFCNEQNQSR